jgi:hypothetical protein
VKGFASIIVAGVFAASAAAQNSAAPAGAQNSAARAAAEQRYQIGQMERVLEGAVEHGLSVTRDRVQALAQMPPDMLVSDNAHARGFRLEGYGIFFDVIVPSFETTWTWSLRTLDQNDLGIESAMRTLQSHVKTENDPDLEQALKRLQLQLGPGVLARTSTPADPGARNATGSAASSANPSLRDSSDPILTDPNEAYRTEVLQALKDAMLAHSSSLAIGPNEWLTIAAKGNDDRPRLAPADSGSGTRIIRLRGSDLIEFLAGRIARDEVLKRIEVRTF